MKNVFVMMLVLCFVGAVQADLWTDGGADPDFETRDAGTLLSPNFGTWTNGGCIFSTVWNTEEGFAAKSGTGMAKQTMPTTAAAGQTGTMTDPVDVPAGKTIRFGAWIRSDDAALVKVEMGFDNADAGGGWISNGTIVDVGTGNFGNIENDTGVGGLTNKSDTAGVDATWRYYEVDNAAGETFVQMSGKIAPISPGGATEVTVYWDAATLFVAPVPFATQPDPADETSVAASRDTLSWTPAVPNIETDTITQDVWILDAGTDGFYATDPNMAEGSQDTGVGTYTKLADNVTVDTLTLSTNSPSYDLLDGHYYYWAIQSSDPNTGGTSTVTEGTVWQFDVGDALPVCDAGPDVFGWVDRADGDGDDEEFTFTTVGTYTDEGKSAIADANWLNLGWDIDQGQNGLKKVSESWTPGPGIHTAGTVTAVWKTVKESAGPPSTDIPGFWDLQLQVTDAGGKGIDVAYSRVDEDCLASAIADLDDDWAGTEVLPDNSIGDINGDCKTNLADFAELASAWLNCHSTKAGVTCP